MNDFTESRLSQLLADACSDISDLRLIQTTCETQVLMKNSKNPDYVEQCKLTLNVLKAECANRGLHSANLSDRLTSHLEEMAKSYDDEALGQEILNCDKWIREETLEEDNFFLIQFTQKRSILEKELDSRIRNLKAQVTEELDIDDGPPELTSETDAKWVREKAAEFKAAAVKMEMIADQMEAMDVTSHDCPELGEMMDAINDSIELHDILNGIAETALGFM